MPTLDPGLIIILAVIYIVVLVILATGVSDNGRH